MDTINNFAHPSVSACDFTIALIDADQKLNNHITHKLRAAGATVLQAFSSDEIPPIIAQNPDLLSLILFMNRVMSSNYVII